MRSSTIAIACLFIVATGCSPAKPAATSAPAGGNTAAKPADDHGHDHADGHDHDHGDGHDHGEASKEDDGHDHAADHGHHHEAPHGGTLVMLGDHVGHLEFVFDPAVGALVLYVLDGEAVNPVRLQTGAIPVLITIGNEAPRNLPLAAVENVLTGETKTSTSQFGGHAEFLKGVSSFKGVVPMLDFRGIQMKNIAFEIKD